MPSPLLTAKEWGSSDQVPARGLAPPSAAEVSKVGSPETSSRRSAVFPLAVLPIYVRSPLVQDFKHPPTTPEDEGRGCFGTEMEEDSLFSNSELTVWALSSILWDSDLMRADAMFVEDVLAYCFKERPPYVRMPLFVCLIFDFSLPLPLSCSGRWLPM